VSKQALPGGLKNFALDAVGLEIAWSQFQAVIDEGETTLLRTAFSPIIREAYDFGVVLLDASGGSVAQSRRSLTSFVGTLPRTLRAALDAFPPEQWGPNDAYATNDPWIGTGHLPDITMMRAVVRNERIIAYVGCIAHWADIGGTIWSGDTTEIFEEGLQLPLCKLVDAGEVNPWLASIIAANVRLPEQVLGDLRAQLATLEVASRRLNDVLDDMDCDDPTPIFTEIQDRSEAVMRAAIREMPDGVYVHEMEIDGFDTPLVLHVQVRVQGESIEVDWTGSSGQVERGMNETFNHAYAMSVYPIKCVLSPEIPNNEGSYRPISMVAPEGSIINARYPAPVATRQILGHYISTVVLNAMAQMLPDRVIAESGSPSPRVVFSGTDRSGKKYGAALLLAGGMGANSWRDGLSATPFPSNAAATSVEMVESNTPLLFRRRALVPDSGGAGRFRGGLGVATEIEVLGQQHCVVSVMTDRINHPPLGFDGGGAGAPNIVTRDGEPIPSKSRSTIKPGQLLSLRTAGGAGYGPSSERDPESVRRDVENGYVSADAARARHGSRQ
jgi:N-methylhydantoinase B